MHRSRILGRTTISPNGADQKNLTETKFLWLSTSMICRKTANVFIPLFFIVAFIKDLNEILLFLPIRFKFQSDNHGVARSRREACFSTDQVSSGLQRACIINTSFASTPTTLHSTRSSTPIVQPSHLCLMACRHSPNKILGREETEVGAHI